MKIVVSGIPRGYHFPKPDGNWLQDRHRQQIRQVSTGVELVEIPPDQVGEADLSGVEIALAEGGNRTHYPGELDWDDYQRLFCPSLRWVQLCSTGFSDNVTPEVLGGTVTLTNAPGLHTVAIAESVLAGMLAHAKLLDARRRDQQAREWRSLRCDEISGRTVLIIGLGRIGFRVAQLCRAFGMRVIGTRRSSAQLPEHTDLVFAPTDLGSYLPEADYVVVAAPLTPETEGMVGERQLAAMKSTAYLVNVGRGKIIDEAAMTAALREHRIAGAYLDVFEEEPLPPEHPLWGLDNALVVPHDSHSSPAIGDRMVSLFCDNLRRYVAGEPLRNVCDPARGY